MIKVTLSNDILKYITEIDKNRYNVSSVKLSKTVSNKLRKNSKKKSSYASLKIEGNPLNEEQANLAIEKNRHLLKPEQEIKNYLDGEYRRQLWQISIKYKIHDIDSKLSVLFFLL